MSALVLKLVPGLPCEDCGIIAVSLAGDGVDTVEEIAVDQFGSGYANQLADPENVSGASTNASIISRSVRKIVSIGQDM